MPDSELQRAFGENLRAHRKAQGLSQEAFAKQLGVHRTYLADVERGERNLTLKSVEKIAGQIGKQPLAMMRPSRRK